MTTTEPLRAADPDAVRAALRHAAAHGPYFTVTTGEGIDTGGAGAGTADASGWLPLATLADPGAGELRRLIGVYATRLRVGEPRVAASLLFQGLAARLWSPLLACAAAGGPLPHLAPDRTVWRYRAGGPVELWAPEPAGWEVPARVLEGRRLELLAAQAARLVVGIHLRPLAGALREVVPVAAGLLWGNAASSLAGALGVLEQVLEQVQEQMLEQGSAAALTGKNPPAVIDLPVARELVARLLDTPPLRGAGTLTGNPVTGPVAFRRRSCCLYYRVPGGGKCGDCVLAGVAAANPD